MAGSRVERSNGEVRDAALLRRSLLAWYRRHRRALPWRETRDPYRVWVSEVMLQQTQVATATPYYERFVALFPDVRALARASRDRVLAAWSGLGYYRRARHLHEAAGIVVRDHAASIPSDPRAFGALPGVGRYTVGAVLSIGFGARLPVLDGNVARVLARLTGRALSVRRPADAKVLWAMAERLMPPARPAGRAGGRRTDRGGADERARAAERTRAAERRAGGDPGDFNEAMMELGATVCTPRAPRCEACPLSAQCRALATGQQESLPPAAERRATVRLRRAIVRLTHRGRVLVVRRAGGLLDGLWEPPGVELVRGDDPGRRLAGALGDLGVEARLADTGERLRHTITHRDIVVQLWRGVLAGRAPRAGTHLKWAEPGSRLLALTALGRRLVDRQGD